MAKGQKQFEDMKDETIPEVTKLATSYFDVIRKRLKVQAEEKKAKAELLDEMKKRKLDVYRDVEADVLVEIEEKENVVVSKPSEADEE